MTDLSTAAGVLQFAEERRAEMTECFERLGRFEANGYSFCAYVFATLAVELTDEGVESVGALPAVEARLVELPSIARYIVPPERHGAAFGEILRRYIRATRAIGVLSMTEMWHAVSRVVPGESFAQARGKLPRQLKDATGRGECLGMLLTHKATGHRHWRAAIHREPTRLEPWQQLEGRTEIGGNLLITIEELG